MKKKFRDITVDGVEYAWLIFGHYGLRIFKDKKVIFEETNLYGSTITPKVIETIIREFLI